MPQPIPNQQKPLTDPADLIRLIGWYFATLIIYIFTVTYIFKQEWGGASFLGLVGLLMQARTIRLWRSLRDQRLAAKAALEKKASALALNAGAQEAKQ